MGKRQKYGGRLKGTPNVITSDLRRFLKQAVTDYLFSDLETIEPTKRAELLIRCLPYVMPPHPSFEPDEIPEPLTLVLTRDACARCDASKVV